MIDKNKEKPITFSQENYIIELIKKELRIQVREVPARYSDRGYWKVSLHFNGEEISSETFDFPTNN